MLCKIDKTDSLSLILRQWSTYLSLCKSYKCSLNLSCDPIFWERYRERERMRGRGDRKQKPDSFEIMNRKQMWTIQYC